MNNLRFHHNEQGSAILITLGILTLVLVLALVFVGTSQNARTIAGANADNGKAALLADSTGDRTEAVVHYVQTEIADANKIPTDSSVSKREYDYLPFVGNFPTGSLGLDQLLPAKHFLVQLGGSNTGPKALQSILYTHDNNNQGNNSTAKDDFLLPYSLIAGTKLGKYLEASTGKFESMLFTNPATRFTYRNTLDSDGHVQSRYAFMMLSEGGKLSLNQMVLAKDGGNDNYVPVVDGGKLDASNSPGLNLGTPNKSTFAIAGYVYDSAGKITDLKDSGKYAEDDTLQYGLHPQELRITMDVPGLADELKLNDSDNPSKWFTYDNYLKFLWDENDATDPMLDFWHLYSLVSGGDDREVIFHGTEADANECSTDNPKGNLALPGDEWDNISIDLTNNYLEGSTLLKTVNDYLTDNFQSLFGKALDSDTTNNVLFKDNDGIDITDQVFVNLVDFCDEDDVVTYEATVGTDRLEFNTPSADFSNAIQVKSCGNEKTPAVIGVRLELTNCDRTATSGNNGTGTWSVSGSGTISYRVRVVLQNYFNEEIDLPAKVRVVIKGKINPWYAGYYTPIGGGANVYQFHGCTHSINLPTNDYTQLHNGTFEDLVNSNPNYSTDSVEFVLDHTQTLSAGSLDSRKVDDTTIDFTGTHDLGLTPLSNIRGCLQRAGIWLQVTDVLVMTGVVDATDPSKTNIMDIAYANGDTHTILWTKDAVRIVMPWTQYRPLAWLVAQDPRCNHKDWQWFDELEQRAKNGETGFPLAVYKWTNDNTIGLATSVAFGMQNKLRKAALSNIRRVCQNGNLSNAKDLEPDLNFVDLLSGDKTTNTFSTAFIPNHPITSLWQLGAVSRGVPGQTINLKKYGGPESDLRYSDGDAWLLDYFKLNELDAISPFPGKFNPNCFNADAYRYLFANIPANPDLIPPTSTDSASETNPDPAWVYQHGRLDLADVRRNAFYDWFIDDNSDAILLEGQLFDFNKKLNYENESEYDEVEQSKKQSWSPVEAFYNFVQFKDTPKYKVKTGSDSYGFPTSTNTAKNANDRMVESLIGCTAGLLSTRYEYFTVFAVGQSVKYIGQTHTNTRDDYLPVTPVKPELGYTPGTNSGKDFYNQLVNPVQINTGTANEWYSVLSTQMRLLTIERDCWFNTMRVVRTQLY